MRFETRIANIDGPGDHWTDGAIASLVGQQPSITSNFNHAEPLGKATVVDARRDGNDVLLTLEVPDGKQGDRVKSRLGGDVAGRPHVGIGYVPEHTLSGIDHPSPLDRDLLAVRLVELSRLGAMTPAPESSDWGIGRLTDLDKTGAPPRRDGR